MRINKYGIRSQLKAFADRNTIFGWVEWKQRISVYAEFHCHRTIDLSLDEEYMADQASKYIFSIQSHNCRDQRRQTQHRFEFKQDKSSKSPPHSSLSTPSSSESCSKSAKDLLKRLTTKEVKTWLEQTSYNDLAESWFTQNVNGQELLQISRTGCLINGTFMLSLYDSIKFKDMLNRFELELE
ncbi:unnamed protein product [Rotaria magnacalcarata]|uniref:SAM domain-containing protein n=1 Tax=Rotaria magnacalcarata TaxID=392030 RepID=A0A816QWQ0_9BILA|nr:unnamed protein product [Rotaria magnacalcarata]